jgi:LacI family transcriptional regulator
MMVSLKDVANAAGVSVETVSRVLKGKYKGRTERSRAVMQRVHEAADRLDYRPNMAARATRTRRSGLVGVVVGEDALLTHPVFTETLKGLVEAMDAAGYIVTITSLAGISEATLNHRIFQEHVLDGMFIVDDVPAEQIEAMRERIPACVMINTNEFQSHCCIRRDEYHAGLTAGSELASRGYREARYFDMGLAGGRVAGHYSAEDRWQGFAAGFGDRAVERLCLDPGQVHAYLREHAADMAPHTVLVCVHNLRLYRVVTGLAQMSLRAGVDVGLVTLDDETGLLSSFPEVARVTFPRLAIGRGAAEMMVSLLNGELASCQSRRVQGVWQAGTTAPFVVGDSGSR